jgi:hypothetical protein
MYVTRKYKPDRPITEKEAIIMIKQLGMMHILYHMRGRMAKMMHDFSHMREILGNIPPEKALVRQVTSLSKGKAYLHHLRLYLTAQDVNYEVNSKYSVKLFN